MDVITLRKYLKIIDMKDGLITRYELDGYYYQLVNNGHKVVKDLFEQVLESNVNDVRVHKPYKRYKNMIDVWIKKNGIKKFNVDDFFKDVKHSMMMGKLGKRYRSRFDGYISKMIEDKSLVQLGNDCFQVVSVL